MMNAVTTLFLLLLILTAASCRKYKDTPGAPDPRLSRPYCNDPEGVNYNWDFPGTPDNTTCFYPADVFKGNYTYTDSVYDGSQNLVGTQVLNLTVSALSRTKLSISGFCPSGAISLTATRRLRADTDTLITNGQLLCRPQDTLNGSVTRPELNGPISFDFMVASDTGVNYHRGSAVKR